MQKVTIFDIAEEANVSPSTVSRVLNDSELISSEQADKIHRIAKKLGYEKRTIRKSRARSILNIMIILPRHRERAVQLFYDYSDLLNGIQTAIPTDHANIFTTTDQHALLNREHKKGGGLDGVIFAFCQPDDSVQVVLEEKKIPFLVLNRILPDVDFVTCDHVAGMMQMVSLLIEKKPDVNPCFLLLKMSNDVYRHRRDGFLAGAAEAGISDPESHIIEIDSIAELNGETVKQICGNYNAVMCFNDVVAIGFMEIAKAAGVLIPKELAITGFDNSPVRDLVHPRLDTMSLDVDQLGQAAGAWLTEKVINRGTDLWQQYIAAEYVPGETIGGVEEYPQG